MNKIELIWKKIEGNQDFNKQIIKFRAEFKIPCDGFSYNDDNKSLAEVGWFDNFLTNPSFKKKYGKKFRQLLNNVKKKCNEPIMLKYLNDYIIYNNPFLDDGISTRLLDIMCFDKNQKIMYYFDYFEVTDKLKHGGTYVRISPYATPTDIYNELVEREAELKKMQKVHIKNEGLSLFGNLRKRTTTERDKIIKQLLRQTSIEHEKQLRKLYKKNHINKTTRLKSRYKYILEILKYKYDIIIRSATLRKIVERMKN